MLRWHVPVLVACLCAAPAAANQAPALTDLVDMYLAGRFDEAIAAAADRDLALLQQEVEEDLPKWIGRGSAADQRAAAVAGFLLELMEARLQTDFQRFVGPMELICARLRESPRTRFERIWYQATIAVAGRARAGHWLIGDNADVPRLPAYSPRLPSSDRRFPMHITHAIDRFPDERSFELARIVAWTWTRDDEPMRNAFALPSASESTGRRANLIKEAIARLQELANEPGIRAAASIRAGQLSFALGLQADALQAFETASRAASTSQERYLSFFLTGRTLVALKRPDDAMRAYTDALAVLPYAESASVALAALQFVHGDRADAPEALQRSIELPRTSDDPGRLAGYGTYMYWPELRAALRAELRP